MAWLMIVVIMSGGRRENEWVISKSMRIPVMGARTTQLKQALIPSAAMATGVSGPRWKMWSKVAPMAYPLAPPKKISGPKIPPHPPVP